MGCQLTKLNPTNALIKVTTQLVATYCYSKYSSLSCTRYVRMCLSCACTVSWDVGCIELRGRREHAALATVFKVCQRMDYVRTSCLVLNELKQKLNSAGNGRHTAVYVRYMCRSLPHGIVSGSRSGGGEWTKIRLMTNSSITPNLIPALHFFHVRYVNEMDSFNTISPFFFVLMGLIQAISYEVFPFTVYPIARIRTI